MEYTLSVLNDSARISELIELFRTGLGETTEEYWMWRLFTDNGQPDRPIAIVVEDEKGKMCGMSSILPVVYGRASSERKCVQFCDWVVHPSHRGKGIIKMIYEYAYCYYRDKGYDFIIEFPNDNSYPIFKKFGFHEEPHVDCWNSSKHLFRRKHQTSDVSVNGVDVCFTDSCPLTDEAFHRDDKIVRTSAFLRWKYDQNPEANYKWVGFKQNGSYIGYIAYVLTKGRFRTAVNVYDWEYPISNNMAFKMAMQAISKQGNFLSVWGRYDRYGQEFLKQCGLKSIACNTRLMLKSISDKGWPEKLTLTRIDTDY